MNFRVWRTGRKCIGCSGR